MKLPAVAVLGGVAALGAAAIEYAQNQTVSIAAWAALAGLIAVGIAGLALSLPGLGWRGLITGGFFVVAGMLAWTFIDDGKIVWGFLLLEGVVFAILGFPWLRDALRLPRLGAAWLGLAYWLLGIVGAVLVWHPTVAAQRVAYLGVFTLAALTAVALARRGQSHDLDSTPDGGIDPGVPDAATGDSGSVDARTLRSRLRRIVGPLQPARVGGEDVTVGITAAFLLVIALLLLAGSATAFQAIHPVPGGPQGILWGSRQQGRFWGGDGLLYHPNSIGLIAVLCGIRIGASRSFARWQRLAALAVTALMLYLVVSRTAILYAGVAALLHAALLWLRRGVDLPAYRRRWVAALLPLAVVGLVYVSLGGLTFLTVSRYAPPPSSATAATITEPTSSDPTSGRKDTWIEVGRQWQAAGWAEKTFGDAKTSRAVVRRGPTSPKLTTDNAAVGALRRGGVAGELAFLFGMGLMLVHATIGPRLRRRRPESDADPGPHGINGTAGIAPGADAAAAGGGTAGINGAAGTGGTAVNGSAGAAGTGLNDSATSPARGRPGHRTRAWIARRTAGRQVPAAWFTITAVGSVSTLATSDWVLGGTGGTLWILLVAGEAGLLYGAARKRSDRTKTIPARVLEPLPNADPVRG